MTSVFNPAPNSTFGLIEPGNITNLYNRPVLKNPDGTWSTTSSASWNIGGLEVLLPTVVDGKRLTSDEAIARYKRTGQHLGKFATPQAADYYAQKLHESQEAMGNFYGANSLGSLNSTLQSKK